MSDTKSVNNLESQDSVKPVILVVDDEDTIRSCLKEALEAEGHKVYTSDDGGNSLRLTKELIPDLVILDLKMPGMNGLDLLREIKLHDQNILVILLTGHASVDSAVSAMKAGAFDYLEKPFKMEHIKVVVDKALSTQSLMREVSRLRAKTNITGDVNIIAVSKEMKEIVEHVKIIAQSPSSTVLIHGESGTGKELIANYIHMMSARNKYRFMEVNCAALTENLLESELFGYEKGSFTGAATTGKAGLFEATQRGTMFLDEIGEMPPYLQTKLLRVLQDRAIVRVGANEPHPIDIRVVAATHQDLDARVKQGLFREDLYHRLNVIRLRLPSLRERREDIPLLARYFLAKSARDLGVEAKRLSDAAMAYLAGQSFPGNVRQLENICHWLTVMAPTQVIEAGDLPAELRTEAPVAETDWLWALAHEVERMLARGESSIMESLATRFEKTLIAKALAHTGGRRIEAANLLGIGRNTITRKIAELGLEEKETPPA